MKFSINPVTVYKIIAEQRGSSKARVSEYLESIAKEARDLADIWEKIGEVIIDKGFANFENSAGIKDYHNVIIPKNAMPFYRLSNFYRQISLVTHGKVEGSQDIHLSRRSQDTHLSWWPPRKEANEYRMPRPLPFGSDQRQPPWAN